MPSVVHRIHELSSRHEGRTALVPLRWDAATSRYARSTSVTFGQLHDRVLRLADALAARGLRRGDRVAVLLDNSVELVVTEWACLVSGLVWVALNTRSSAAENAAILADSAPSVLITSASHLAHAGTSALGPRGLVVLVESDTPPGARDSGAARSAAPGTHATASSLGDALPGGGDSSWSGAVHWSDLLAEGRARLPEQEPGEEDIVRIRYTSGTAGLPKGAMLARRCYDASLDVVTGVIGPLAPDDVLAQVAPMTHAAGAMWLPHAVAGACALVADRFDAAAFVELAARERVTSAFLVPTMLVRFVEALEAAPLDGPSADARPRHLRSIVYGGAAMPVDRLEKALALLGPVLVQIYGLTESNWPVAALLREDHVVRGDAAARRRRLASCGRPTPVGEVRVVDGAGREVSPGEPGEMLVRGRNTMTGYWRRSGRDATVGDLKGLDAEGWMHTGDVAVRDADGFLTIVDRLHDMIVSGGFNVYPREVEDALSSHPAVLEAAVVGRPDPEWGERVHAAVVLRGSAAAAGPEDRDALARELAGHVATLTAAYKKPRSIEFVAELPKNASGKVLRRALRTTKPPA